MFTVNNVVHRIDFVSNRIQVSCDGIGHSFNSELNFLAASTTFVNYSSI